MVQFEKDIALRGGSAGDYPTKPKWLQYQAPRKATGTVQGRSAQKVNQMAGVESADIRMDNNQVRFVARFVEDPSKLGDMMVAEGGN